MKQLTKNHFYLIELAKNLCAKRFKEGRHHLVSALRTRSGKIFTGIQLIVSAPQATVCAGSVAIGAAACEGDIDIEALVIVDRYGKVLPPCGSCRELIIEYSPNAEIIVPSASGCKVVGIQTLFPLASSSKIPLKNG